MWLLWLLYCLWSELVFSMLFSVSHVSIEFVLVSIKLNCFLVLQHQEGFYFVTHLVVCRVRRYYLVEQSRCITYLCSYVLLFSNSDASRALALVCVLTSYQFCIKSCIYLQCIFCYFFHLFTWIYMKARYARTEKSVKDLNLSVDLLKKESVKLLQRTALAEKEMKYGHTELQYVSLVKERMCHFITAEYAKSSLISINVYIGALEANFNNWQNQHTRLKPVLLVCYLSLFLSSNLR